MPSRWKHDRPLARARFEARFPDDAACADYLARRRWPEGFVCPCCGGAKGWALKGKRFTWECAACRRQTSVTAGTVMHGSHLPLKTWFTAIHIVTSHSNGISALQLQAQLGQLQERLAAADQAPPRHGRPRAQPARGRGRDRRDRDPAPPQ